MRKISIKNLFKKSESDTGKSKNRLLIALLIILIIAGIVYWGYPLIFSNKSVSPNVTTATRTTIPSQTIVVTKTDSKAEVKEKEKTPFEIEMEKRKQAYENKIFVYEPYEPPSNRNPFQKLSTSYFLVEGEKKEEGEEDNVLRLPKPELPPGTKLTGVIGTEDKKIAMIEMNGETFIANLYDILLDKYIVKEIKKDEVVLELNDYEFSIKIGGEEASNE